MGNPGETNSVVARWGGDWQASVEIGSFTVAVDEPPEVGGSGTGPMPTDYLLASLASCYALALAWAARKREVELTELSVQVTGRYGKLRFDALTVTVGSNLSDEEIEPLLTAASRTCYVSNTLLNPPELEIRTEPVG